MSLGSHKVQLRLQNLSLADEVARGPQQRRQGSWSPGGQIETDRLR